MIPPLPISTLFPYTTHFRSRPPERIDEAPRIAGHERHRQKDDDERQRRRHDRQRHFPRPLDGRFERRAVLLLDVADRKSTRLNSSHQIISYAVFCLKKKKQQ